MEKRISAQPSRLSAEQMLERLNQCNDVAVRGVWDAAFRSYGRVLQGYDFHELADYMENQTQIPEQGNVYLASVEDMERTDAAKILCETVYGGMPIQIGYCNGRNTTYNGFEYHKGSEINVAVTDFMLALGHSYDIEDNRYDVSMTEVFFVPKGTAVEMYQTTLHLSPLRVCDEGFKGIVILPKGTNTPLNPKERAAARKQLEAGDPETRLLLQRNKWVIAHPDREPLMKQGACGGVTGENKELFY